MEKKWFNDIVNLFIQFKITVYSDTKAGGYGMHMINYKKCL